MGISKINTSSVFGQFPYNLQFRDPFCGVYLYCELLTTKSVILRYQFSGNSKLSRGLWKYFTLYMYA